MLYKFRSRAAAPVILLGRSGERLLRAIGKSPAARGVISNEELPLAVELLDTAIEEEEDETLQAPSAEHAEADVHAFPIAEDDRVSLRQRAWPLIEMMERCLASGDDIVWETAGANATRIARSGS
jgi:hypothetical protein